MTDTIETVDTIDTVDTTDTVGASNDLPPVVDVANTKKTRKVPVRRDESELKELVNKYIKSGLTITEYCRKNKEVAGTLVKNLEDDGYRMTLGTAQDCTAGGTQVPSELQAENDRLLNNYIKLLQKYEPDKHKMAMLACMD